MGASGRGSETTDRAIELSINQSGWEHARTAAAFPCHRNYTRCYKSNVQAVVTDSLYGVCSGCIYRAGMDAPSPRPERTKEQLRSNVAARRSETCRRRNSPSNRPHGRVPVPGPSKVRVRSFFCTSSGRIPGDGGDPSGATAAAVPRTCTRPLTPGSRRSSPLLIGGIRRPCRHTGGPRISVPPCSWTLARSRTTLPAGFQNRSRLRRRRRGVGSRANHLVVVFE